MPARLWLPGFLALCAAVPAGAAGFAETRFFAGSGALGLESLDAAVATASGTVAGLGFTRYTERRLSEQVLGLRGNLSRAFGTQTWGLRGYHYPRAGGSQASGGSAYTQQRAQDSEGEYQGSWGLAATWVQHQVRSLPTAPPKRDLRFGEGVLEFNSRQSYFEEFHFLLSAAWFAYDRSVREARLFKTTFLQTDAASLGTFAPVTEPPRWNVSVQYARQVGGPGEGTVMFGYARTGLAVGGRALSSYLLGVQAKLTEQVGLQVGYNMVRRTREHFRHYAGATAAFTWR